MPGGGKIIMFTPLFHIVEKLYKYLVEVLYLNINITNEGAING